jgi:hypothetical protein
VIGWSHLGGTMTKSQRSKLPLLVVMAGGLCFALGYKTLGLILTGVGGMLFVWGFMSDQP